MWFHRSGRRGVLGRLGIVAVVGTAVIGTATAATGAEDDAAARTAPGGGGEFVVAFDGSADAAVDAIEAAGGTVEDVTEEVGVALVSAGDAAFAADALARDGITGVARNHSVGTARPGMPHRFAEERPSATERSRAGRTGIASSEATAGRAEPLAWRQWNMRMIGATPGGAHRTATGTGVDVGIIDTGIDARHPDLRRNVDRERSRNFTRDIPSVDGPCEYRGCKDPAHVDHNGHGTHVAGIVAAADDGFGIGGVAPDATLVNVRAGQDSGFFFLYETVKAIVYAGDIRLDVVNMSFYTDPWLYNCTKRSDYVRGSVTNAELTEQRITRELLLGAVEYAHHRGVTLVGAAGNEHVNLAAPTRVDETSPDFPLDTARPRVVRNTCLNLPSEAPQVIGVSAVGPSTTKADYSNYGLGDIEIAAPGGWFRDRIGTPAFQTPGNLILSSYPRRAALEQGLIDRRGRPVDDFTVRYCNSAGRCGFYTYLQGTSMAAPHVAGVAALVIGERGRLTGNGGRALSPATVARVLARTADDRACPRGGVEVYTDEGRTPEWNAVCRGTIEKNGHYGQGVVDARAAVR